MVQTASEVGMHSYPIITKTPLLSLPEQIQEIFKIKVALLQRFRLLQQGVTSKEVA